MTYNMIRWSGMAMNEMSNQYEQYRYKQDKQYSDIVRYTLYNLDDAHMYSTVTKIFE